MSRMETIAPPRPHVSVQASKASTGAVKVHARDVCVFYGEKQALFGPWLAGLSRAFVSLAVGHNAGSARQVLEGLGLVGFIFLFQGLGLGFMGINVDPQYGGTGAGVRVITQFLRSY